MKDSSIQAVMDQVGDMNSGHLGYQGAMESLHIWVANIRLDPTGTWLIWDRAEGAESRFESPETVLDQFVKLGTDRQGIARFSQRYGPLGICEHGIPYHHNPPWAVDLFHFSDTEWVQPLSKPIPCRPLRFRMRNGTPTGEMDQAPMASLGPIPVLPLGTYGEPVQVWFDLIERARATLRLLADVREQRLGDANDWSRVIRDPELRAAALDDEALNNRAVLRRRLLEQHVDTWVRLANVHPAILSGRNGSIGWTGSLFGAIGMQLMAVLTRGHRLGICDFCGSPYVRQRQPKKAASSVCSRKDCIRAASAERKRKQRQRDKEGTDDHQEIQAR